MANDTRIAEAIDDLRNAIRVFENRCRAAGAYMPAIATQLRIHADEMAERYPDDTNGGASHDAA